MSHTWWGLDYLLYLSIKIIKHSSFDRVSPSAVRMACSGENYWKFPCSKNSRPASFVSQLVSFRLTAFNLVSFRLVRYSMFVEECVTFTHDREAFMFKVVVGNRFKSSTHNANYISMQDYLASHRDMQGVMFIPGQGVNVEERNFILSNNVQQVSSDLLRHITQQCRTSVHKSKQQNVVISQLTPILNKDLTYKASLVVDNENELILDHVSGYHVPGMIFGSSAESVGDLKRV